jgi:thioredoxin-like negative regulator of GroEL
MNRPVQATIPVYQISHYKMNQKPFVLFFQTEACGVCHAIAPRLMEMLEKYGTELILVDAIKHPSIAGQHQVFTVPTIIIWAENREVLRESRFVNFSKIERALEFMQIYETSNEVLNYTNN